MEGKCLKNGRVVTESGILQGEHGWDPRILVFRGIPYAQPPVGELRWRAPQPVEKWEGIRKAVQYGPMAVQNTPGEDENDFWTREIHPTGPEFEMSEDCLYLNVYTPARKESENLPVLFYIHGGGYAGGYSYEVEFDWEHMARKGMVVVSVGYRLGVLGFLAHPGLSARAADEAKGNYGLQDQVFALQWVKRNIAAFGGNPERITIAGQSAGAGAVQCLLSCEEAKGLIAGAVIESGVTMNIPDSPDFLTPVSLGEAEKNGRLFFERAGITDLRTALEMPAEELCRLWNMHMHFGEHLRPTVDGILLKQTTFEALRDGNWPDIPVLAGYNRGEVVAFNRMGKKFPVNTEELEQLSLVFGEKSGEYLQLCGVKEDEEVRALFERDDMLGWITASYALAHIQQAFGRKVFLYEFNAEIPGEENGEAFHGSEMWFAYDSLARCWRPFTGKHYDLARQISSYWANFIRTGNPNGKDSAGKELPVWKNCTDQEPGIMVFTDRGEMRIREPGKLMRFRMASAICEQRADSCRKEK